VASETRKPEEERGNKGEFAVALAATGAAGAGVYGATEAAQPGPFIAGVVAIVVALITWYATDRRQSKALADADERQADALAAEDTRHAASLAAENTRHAATLTHAARRQDVEELRRVLDSTMDLLFALDEANRQLGATWYELFQLWNVGRSWFFLGRTRRTPRAWLAARPMLGRLAGANERSLTKEHAAAVEAQGEALHRLGAATFRLSLRMGSDHEAVRALLELGRLSVDSRRLLTTDPRRDRDAFMKFQDRVVQAPDIMQRIQRAAHEEIQVRSDAAS
jgi:hypothetical protein